MVLFRRRAARLRLALSLEDENDLRYVADPKGMRPGHRCRLLIDGHDTFPAMLDAIRAARTFVHLETYIFESDRIGHRFGEALIAKAKAGVAVRLILDAVGCLDMSAEFADDLRDAGVEIVEYMPLAPWRRRWGWWRRDHRKILVVDGKVGFTGGLNIGDNYASVQDGGVGWRDTHVRIEGPAVGQLEAIFSTTWHREGGKPYLPYPVDGDESVATAGTSLAQALANGQHNHRAVIRRAYLHAILASKRTLLIANAYFVPDFGIRRALVRAARRGVQVRIIVPRHSDVKAVAWAGQRTYSSLLRAGVRLFEWTGAMMHAKTAVVDGVWSTVGSYNLDSMSLFRNLEVVLQVVGRDFGATVIAAFENDQARCEELALAVWRRRPWWRKGLEWLFYQLRAWL